MAYPLPLTDPVLPDRLDPEIDASASPLASTLSFAAWNSLACGVATNGVFFVAEVAYGFRPLANYGLGLVLGTTYVAGALLAGPALRRLRRRHPEITGRAVLRWIGAVMAALALLPLIPGVGRAGPWIFMALYSPLCGALWPIVESYVSGGRSGASLRRAVGRFNITWSLSSAAGYWALAPLLSPGRDARFIFLGLSAAHLASLLPLHSLPGEPGRHADAHPRVPPSYPVLLRVHRVLLVASYLVMYALVPYLPALFRTLGVDGAAAAILASSWLSARVVTFAAMERLQAWHGRFATAGVGLALVAAGFAGALLAPYAGGAGGLGLCVVGLFAFGVGCAVLYCAALYYVLAVGGAEVDAGSSHEALIGLGYTFGPLIGLLACIAVRTGWLAESQRESATLLAVAAASLLVLATLRRR